MSDYARNHDGRLPFAPVADLEELRRDVSTSCTILMDLPHYVTGERREERIAEAIRLAGYFDDLLTAAIYRRAATDAQHAAERATVAL